MGEGVELARRRHAPVSDAAPDRKVSEIPEAPHPPPSAAIAGRHVALRLIRCSLNPRWLRKQFYAVDRNREDR